jgi:hypothetical protein
MDLTHIVNVKIIQHGSHNNVNVKFTPEEAMKAQRWSSGIAPLFL